jgi:hypothetical protein
MSLLGVGVGMWVTGQILVCYAAIRDNWRRKMRQGFEAENPYRRVEETPKEGQFGADPIGR